MNRVTTIIFGIAATGVMSACVAARPAREPVLQMNAFGAVGDGVHNDSPALQRALSAVRAAGRPVRLLFDAQTYYLGPQLDSDAHFDFTGLEDVEVDGQGTTLILHPLNGVARFFESRNITFKNFVIQHRPFPFIQGTITEVRDGSFLWRVHDGFPLPQPVEWMRQHGHFFDNPAVGLPERNGWDTRESLNGPWLWGSVLEATSASIKKGFIDHLFVEEVLPAEQTGKRVYEVKVAANYRSHLASLVPGERFVLPRVIRTREQFFQLKSKGWMSEQNVQIRQSSDIIVENLTFYSARPGMVFGVRHNDGRVTVRGCTVTWQPGTDALIASWRDGVHCKNNRIGPVIEDCHFEGLFDDSINLSADTVMIEDVLAPDRLTLTGAAFEAGDEVGVFHPTTGVWETGLTVVQASGRQVVLSRPVEGIVCGTMTPNKDMDSTQIYNLSRANDGFIVRGNFFGIQRRHAVLARCRGLIESNTIQGVAGCALEFSNTSGNFYEGPFPRGLRVRGNRILDTSRTPILVRTKGAATPVTGDIVFKDNEIDCAVAAAVRLECVEDVTFDNNRFTRGGGQTVSQQKAVKSDAISMNIRFLNSSKPVHSLSAVKL